MTKTITELRSALSEMVSLATFGDQCSCCGKYMAIDGHAPDCVAASSKVLLDRTSNEALDELKKLRAADEPAARLEDYGPVVDEAAPVSEKAWNALNRGESR